jgi:hypothetical protein
LKKNGEPRKTKHDWSSVDWSFPTSVIAAQMEVSERYVSGRRRVYAQQTTKKYHIKKSNMIERAKFIDWSKSDTQIANEKGMTRGSVWKMRNKLKKL